MRSIKAWPKCFVLVLGICVVMGGMLTSGCGEGGGDSAAIAAAPAGIQGNVTVVNTPDNPVHTVDAGIRQPFAALANAADGVKVLATVPAGKRLVIETITAETSQAAGPGASELPALNMRTSNVP